MLIKLQLIRRRVSTENVDNGMRPAQCRAARALLDWTQPQLAKVAGLGLSTVVDYERDRRRVSEGAVRAIRDALEGAGIEFNNGKRLGVRLR
jgi:transcriptional regulator with XRE-family HTH domain